MIGRVGVHRADDADVVDALGRRAGYSSLTSMPLWPCLENLNGDGSRPPPLARSVDSSAPGGCVPVVLFQGRLGVEGVDLRGAAVHEQEDDALGLGAKSGALGASGLSAALRGGSEETFAGEHRRQTQGAETAADFAQRLPAVHWLLRWKEHDWPFFEYGGETILSDGDAIVALCH